MGSSGPESEGWRVEGHEGGEGVGCGLESLARVGTGTSVNVGLPLCRAEIHDVLLEK